MAVPLFAVTPTQLRPAPLFPLLRGALAPDGNGIFLVGLALEPPPRARPPVVGRWVAVARDALDQILYEGQRGGDEDDNDDEEEEEEEAYKSSSSSSSSSS
jgi:hypothetical protein